MKSTDSPAPKTNRGTSEENQARVAEARAMLESHYHKGDIKSHLIQRFGIARPTAERLITAAREEILLELRDVKEFARAKSLSVYQRIIRDESTPVRERIKAQIAIDQLLGLREPTKVAMTDVAGRDLPPDEARDRLSALAATIAARIESTEKKLLAEAIPSKAQVRK